VVDHSTLVHTAFDLGSPINTVCWFFQVIVGGEIRVIDVDMDLDITPVERVSRMLSKGHLCGTHFLPTKHALRRRSTPRFFPVSYKGLDWSKFDSQLSYRLHATSAEVDT
jgi:hypothetical protein